MRLERWIVETRPGPNKPITMLVLGFILIGESCSHM